ncbi:hypothetical protein JX265_011047 [Neoarthrinium moseri]|uniref:Uncharacterized protein n=2 Tax=Neoarthrinium moseri TaxID=1658444 RepID=A0A9P9WD56_9PEZI|nr:hypothetical protein JX265_011047 [Neoarthrinium moseri]
MDAARLALRGEDFCHWALQPLHRADTARQIALDAELRDPVVWEHEWNTWHYLLLIVVAFCVVSIAVERLRVGSDGAKSLVRRIRSLGTDKGGWRICMDHKISPKPVADAFALPEVKTPLLPGPSVVGHRSARTTGGGSSVRAPTLSATDVRDSLTGSSAWTRETARTVGWLRWEAEPGLM